MSGTGYDVAQAKGQQLAKQQVGTIQQVLESRRGEFAKLLPKHLSVDRLLRVALTSVGKTPQLQKCSASSLLASVLQCAELGLEPGGALGHAYLVPFGNVCTPIIGYRGFIELARRSGELSSVEAHVVHEKDHYEVSFGLERKLKHTPVLRGDRGPALFAYCVAEFKDGGKHIEVMTFDEIEAIRKRSRSGDNGPWKTDWEEMAKKTVVRRAAKYWPVSSERLARAMDLDNEDVIDGEVLAADSALAAEASGPKETKTAATKKQLAARTKLPVIDVEAGESEEQAEARAKATADLPPGGEPPEDVILPGQGSANG